MDEETLSLEEVAETEWDISLIFEINSVLVKHAVNDADAGNEK